MSSPRVIRKYYTRDQLTEALAWDAMNDRGCLATEDDTHAQLLMFRDSDHKVVGVRIEVSIPTKSQEP